MAVKRLVLVSSIAVLALGFWLHAGERSLSVMKPWIMSAVNVEGAPYVIDIGDVTIDWTNAALLGKMHITGITISKRDGTIFAVLPEVYATVDPIGFMPTRHLLHKVILRQPRMFAARNTDGVVEFGVEGSPARIAFSELTDFFSGKETGGEAKPIQLPFHDFMIEEATLTFTDEASGTKIISSPFEFQIGRRHGTFEAALQMPFTVDEQPVSILAEFRKQARGDQHVAAVQVTQLPMKLFCVFGGCPDKIDAEGKLNAKVKSVVADDFSLHEFHAELGLPTAKLTLPAWFAEPLHITQGNVVLDGDVTKQNVTLTSISLPLTDTTITAKGEVHKAEDGWYANADAEATRLEVNKIYKYWPLIMAPDSRTWITSKLKAGYAAKGTLKLHLTPKDIETGVVADASVDAMADARDITFEYLPGFPPVEHMDGIAHFTGTTVKVEGNTGSLLSGAKVSHAVLWCPELANPKNPMEVNVSLTAPARDAATMLALKYFPFDDAMQLDPATIKGVVDANMKLKFDAFSGHEGGDPNEIHLEKVDYDITANLHDVAQDKLYGSYNARNVNGTLKATNSGLHFAGPVTVGEAGTSDITLSQPDGKPMNIVVKGKAAADAKSVTSRNDFTLSYTNGAVPIISVTGKSLDASASYAAKGTGKGPLANFPAMKLDLNLDELYLAKDNPLRAATGTLNCSAARCEAANFSAKAEKGTIKGGIQMLGGSRQFLMTATDAGSMLKALDITDRMTRGKFEMRGSYDDKKTPPQLNANLRIDDFTLKNSQILGRIFAIGSLTGLQNALTGSGISFDKLTGYITSRGGLITISKAIASGTSMGITTDGTVDTNSTKLALKGVVIPAYALNSILGNIPIIGMIAGGKEGLIAFNYSVKGTYDNPDVGVNPLSGLTPGFLRGIFGVFDSKPAKDDSGDAPAAAPEKPKKFKPVGENQPSNVRKH